MRFFNSLRFTTPLLGMVLLVSSVALAAEDSSPDPVPALAPTQAPTELQNWNLHLELGPVWQTRNDFRLPSGSGTLVDLTSWKSGPSLAQRVQLEYRWGSHAQHEVRGLVAPLTITAQGQLAGDTAFQGQNFVAGTPTTATYQFNSYRVTYRYRVFTGDTWKWWVGITGKLRDAKIALEQAGLSAERKDLGFVPLLHLHGDWAWSEQWSLVLDIDALAAPQGRAEDILLSVQWKPAPRWSYYLGYRTLEGGASNRDVYTFSWLHYLALGLQYAW